MKINNINAWLKLNYSCQTKIPEDFDIFWDYFYCAKAFWAKAFQNSLIKANRIKVFWAKVEKPFIN